MEKKKKADKLLSWLILLVGLGMIGVSVFQLVEQQLDYKASDDFYQEMVDEYVDTSPEFHWSGSDSILSGDLEAQYLGPWYQMISVDLEGVKAVNPEVVAWIYQEGGDRINYPVLYSGDNEKYLRTTMNGKESTAGSLFLEAMNTPDWNDSHSIIYGHNMRNLSMFGCLKYYQNIEGYYDDYPYFQLFLEDEIRRYEVFGFEVINPDSFVYSVPYAPGEKFEAFVNKMKNLSVYKTGVEVDGDDKVITLSTCYQHSQRFVVHAVLVDTYVYAEHINDSEEEILPESTEEIRFEAK